MGKGEGGCPWQYLPSLRCRSLPMLGSQGQQSEGRDMPRPEEELHHVDRGPNCSSHSNPRRRMTTHHAKLHHLPFSDSSSQSGLWCSHTKVQVRYAPDLRCCRVWHRIPLPSKQDHHQKLLRSHVCVAASPPAYEYRALPACGGWTAPTWFIWRGSFKIGERRKIYSQIFNKNWIVVAWAGRWDQLGFIVRRTGVMLL